MMRVATSVMRFARLLPYLLRFDLFRLRSKTRPMSAVDRTHGMDLSYESAAIDRQRECPSGAARCRMKDELKHEQ